MLAAQDVKGYTALIEPSELSQPLRVDLRKGANSVVPLADRAIGNLQQWLLGTHHGDSRNELQIYLDKFVPNAPRTWNWAQPAKYEEIRGASDLDEPPAEG